MNISAELQRALRNNNQLLNAPTNNISKPAPLYPEFLKHPIQQQQSNNNNLKDVYEVILKKYEDDKKQHLSQIQSLTQKFKLNEDRLEKTLQTLEQTKQVNENLKHEHDKLLLKNEDLNSKLSSLVKCESMHENKIRDATEHRLQLQLSFNKLMEKNERLEKRLYKLKMNKQQTTTHVQHLTKELKIMTERASSHVSLELLKKEFNSLMMAKKELESELKMKEIEMSELRNTLLNHKNQLKDATCHNDLLEKDISQSMERCLQLEEEKKVLQIKLLQFISSSQLPPSSSSSSSSSKSSSSSSKPPPPSSSKKRVKKSCERCNHNKNRQKHVCKKNSMDDEDEEVDEEKDDDDDAPGGDDDDQVFMNKYKELIKETYNNDMKLILLRLGKAEKAISRRKNSTQI